MKLHISHLQIQFAKVTIAGALDSPVLVLFSSVTSGSGNPDMIIQSENVYQHTKYLSCVALIQFQPSFQTKPIQI
jgi:hypothetical protein